MTARPASDHERARAASHRRSRWPSSGSEFSPDRRPAPAPVASAGAMWENCSSRSIGSSPNRRMIRLDQGMASVPSLVCAVNSKMRCGSLVGTPEATRDPAGTTVPSAYTGPGVDHGELFGAAIGQRQHASRVDGGQPQDAWGPVPPS
jgi:hypothetical protein